MLEWSGEEVNPPTSPPLRKKKGKQGGGRLWKMSSVGEQKGADFWEGGRPVHTHQPIDTQTVILWGGLGFGEQPP